MFFLVSPRQLACLWLGESDAGAALACGGRGTLCSGGGVKGGFIAVALRASWERAHGCQERLLLSVLTVHLASPFAFLK